jgi:hypothetical protein
MPLYGDSGLPKPRTGRRVGVREARVEGEPVLGMQERVLSAREIFILTGTASRRQVI